MRKLRFFIFLSIAIFFCIDASAFTASYEQTSTGSGIVKPQTQLIKVKDKKIKIEMDTAEGKGIAIIEGDTMISYVPSQNIAYKMKNNMSHNTCVLADYAAYLKSLDAKVVGSEKLGPYDCEIYEFIDPRVNVKSKVWLWKAKKFPVKVEMETPHGPVTTLMKDVKIGVYLDDSEFRLPEGVKVIEVQR